MNIGNKYESVSSKKIIERLFDDDTFVDLDIVWPDDDGQTVTINDLVVRTTDWAKTFGCRAELVSEVGPGGGQPLFRFSGNVDDIKKLVYDYAQDDETADYILNGEQGVDDEGPGQDSHYTPKD